MTVGVPTVSYRPRLPTPTHSKHHRDLLLLSAKHKHVNMSDGVLAMVRSVPALISPLPREQSRVGAAD